MRDVGRALGLAFAEVDRIAKLVPDGLGMTLESALELSPELQDAAEEGRRSTSACSTARACSRAWRATLDARGRRAHHARSAHRLRAAVPPEGRVSHHAVGHEVGREGRPAEDGLPRPAHAVGARTNACDWCSAIAGARSTSRRCRSTTTPTRTRCSRTPRRWPSSSSSRAGMRDYLQAPEADGVRGPVAMNALYRPGPMENIPYFIDCKHGRQVARTTTPRSSRSSRTPTVCSCTRSRSWRPRTTWPASRCRRPTSCGARWGRRSRRRWTSKRRQFIEGCVKNSIPAENAEKIFATMEKFAGYGFNKLTLRRLRAGRLPVRVAQGALPGRVHGRDDDQRNVGQRAHRDADRGVPAHRDRAAAARREPFRWKFTLEDGSIRVRHGRRAQRRARARSRLVGARERGEAFRDLFELAGRLDGRARQPARARSLVAAGACDSLGGERAALFAGVALRARSRRPRCSATARAGRRRCSASDASSSARGGAAAAGRRRVERRAIAARTRRKCSASISRSIRSSSCATRSSASPRTPSPPRWRSKTAPRCAWSALVGEHQADHDARRQAHGRRDARGPDRAHRVHGVPRGLRSASRSCSSPDEIVVVSGAHRSARRSRRQAADVRGAALREARVAFRPALHIEVRAEELSESRLEGVDEVLSSHPGEAEVYLHIVKPDHSRVAMRSRRFRVSEDEAVAAGLRERFPTLRVRWGKGAPVTHLARVREAGAGAGAEDRRRCARTRSEHGVTGGRRDRRAREARRRAAPRDLREAHALPARAGREASAAARTRSTTSSACFTDWIELHGDRHFGDDPAIVGGPGAARRAAGDGDRPAEGPRHQGEPATAASACRTPRAIARRSG